MALFKVIITPNSYLFTIPAQSKEEARRQALIYLASGKLGEEIQDGKTIVKLVEKN